MMVYLNAADGRKGPLLNRTKPPNNPDRLYKNVSHALRRLLHIPTSTFFSSAQNSSTNLIHALQPILNTGFIPVYISTHEIRYFPKIFTGGKLQTHESTRPNYAPQKPVSFVKRQVYFFQPEDLLHNTPLVFPKSSPCIIILSHVSRLTGQTLIDEKLYKKLKKLFPKSIIVIDGAQAMGSISIQANKVSDIYLCLTSKFVGAEPHLSFCWIRSQITKEFGIEPWQVPTKMFVKELLSATLALQSLLEKNATRHIRVLRFFLEQKCAHYRITIWKPARQIDGYALIPVPAKELPGVVKKLKKLGMVVSTNTHWSVTEPAIACLRVSLSVLNTKADIRAFINAFTLIRK